MKHQEKNPATNLSGERPGDLLDRALTSMRAELPDSETMSAAGERAWQRVSQEAFSAAGQVESIRGCEDVRKLLLQYRAGQLVPARALLVEAHLHECVACRREAEAGKQEPQISARTRKRPDLSESLPVRAPLAGNVRIG